MDVAFVVAAVVAIPVLAYLAVRGVRRGFDDGYRHGAGPRGGSGGWAGFSFRNADDSSLTGDFGGDGG